MRRPAPRNCGSIAITGSVLPFSHQLAEEAVASIERVRKKARAEAVKLARSLGRNVDDSAFGLVAGVDEVLAGSAFMFSNLWLDDVLRALNPSLPHMQNTDGEPLEFITVHFQLVSNSNLPAIRAALDDLAPRGRRATPSGTGSRRRRCTGSSQRDRRPIPGPSARRWTTAPSCLAPSNSRRMRSSCRSTRKPGPLESGRCWNRFLRGSCTLPLSSGRPSSR